MVNFYIFVLPLLFLIVIGPALVENTYAPIVAQLYTTGLSFNASPLTPQENQYVTFSGYYLIKGTGSQDRLVIITDMTTGAKLGEDNTDSNGYYTVSWKTSSKDLGTHTIRASSITYYDDVATYEKFLEIDVIPKPVTTLTLNANPLSITEGDAVTFSGSFLYGDDPLPNSLIQINDANNPDKIIGSDYTNARGEYLVTWDTSSANIQTHTFVAKSVPISDDSFASGYFYIPTIFTSDVVAIAVTSQSADCSLDMIATPESTEENLPVNIRGTLLCYNASVFDHRIEIIDSSNNQIITNAFADDNGFYSVSWNAVYRNTPYDLYARYVDDDVEITASNIDTVTVIKSEAINLVLEPLSDVEQGSMVDLFGHITGDGFQGQRVLIRSDGQIVTTARIDANRIFSESWSILDNTLGQKQVIAECECNGRYLQSNAVTFSVIPKPVEPLPLQVQIISDITYGESPLTVTLKARVNGGVPQYTYDWNLNGKRYDSDIIRHTYHTANENPYLVFLVVTDSLQQEKKDEIYIQVNDPVVIKPEISIAGDRLEGSQITFSATGFSLQASDEYRWSFGDGYFGNNHKATHIYDDDGRYNVKLVVKNTDGETSVNREIDIQNKAPEITSFDSQKYTVGVNDNVLLEGKFTDAGKGDTFTATWYIDDKQFTDDADLLQPVNQNYKFEKPGNYVVTLMVIDDEGGHDTQTISIDVEDSFPWLLVVLIILAGCGVAGFALLRNVINPSPGPQPNPSPSVESPPSNPQTPVITVEYRSGIER